MKTNLIKHRGFTPTEANKLVRVVALLADAINDPRFAERVLGHTWNGVRQFADNDGDTNEQVLARIYAGAEKLSPEVDHEIDIDITIYTAAFWKRWRVVGYTYPNTLRTWVNRAYFNSMTEAELTGNFGHEWCHKIEYGHSFHYTPRRPYSVPYGVGAIIAGIAAEIVAERATAKVAALEMGLV